MPKVQIINRMGVTIFDSTISASHFKLKNIPVGNNTIIIEDDNGGKFEQVINVTPTSQKILATLSRPALAWRVNYPLATPATNKQEITALNNITKLNAVTDLGLVGDGATDNYTKFVAGIRRSVTEPIEIYFPKGNYYYKGANNSRVELWPDKSKGLKFVGETGATLLPAHNRTTNQHDGYTMQLTFTSDSKGFQMENMTVDGINSPQDIYKNPESVTNITIPALKGITVGGAKEILVKDCTFKNLFGGGAIIVEDFDQFDMHHCSLQRVGGNAWTENIGYGIYVSGHIGNATVNIDSVEAQGYTDPAYPKLVGWVGFVFENGSMQLTDRTKWLQDANTYINITNSTFADYETGWHVETVAGNTYWNSDNVKYRCNNYAIYAGNWGEIKEASNNIYVQLLPFGRTGLIKGMYYTEKEQSKNESGLNDFRMYNSTIDVIDVPGFESIYQTMSYGNGVVSRYYNTTFNNVPNYLVHNGATELVNSRINLKPDNTLTDTQLNTGIFNRPSQFVTLTNTPMTRTGSYDSATEGAKPAKVKNTGYVPPYIPGPLGPATLERES